MQVNNFFIDLALRLLFIDLHYFIATIQIGVIVQVCYTPRLQCVTYTHRIIFAHAVIVKVQFHIYPAGVVSSSFLILTLDSFSDHSLLL